MVAFHTFTLTIWTVQEASPRAIDFGGGYGMEVVIFFVLIFIINIILAVPGLIVSQKGFKHSVY
jgi:hypothetical protein